MNWYVGRLYVEVCKFAFRFLLTAVTFMESFVETNQVKPKCDDLCDMKWHFHATKVMENEHLA